MSTEFWLMVGLYPLMAAITVFTFWRWLLAFRDGEKHEQWRRDWYLAGLFAGRGGGMAPTGFGMTPEQRAGDRMAGMSGEAQQGMVDKVTDDVRKNPTHVPDVNSAESMVPDETPDAEEYAKRVGRPAMS